MAAIDDLSNLLALLSDPKASQRLLAEYKKHQQAKAEAEAAVAQVKIEKASFNEMQAKIDKNKADLAIREDAHARAVTKHNHDVAEHNAAKANFAKDKQDHALAAKEVAIKESGFKDWESRLKALETKLEADAAKLKSAFALLGGKS